jgi:hypothetical protein
VATRLNSLPRRDVVRHGPGSKRHKDVNGGDKRPAMMAIETRFDAITFSAAIKNR